MQHKTVYLLFCKFTLHVSGVNHTHHQEYTKLTASGTGHIFVQLPLSNVANLVTLEGGSCTVREAVVTILCTPDDWYG